MRCLAHSEPVSTSHLKRLESTHLRGPADLAVEIISPEVPPVLRILEELGLIKIVCAAGRPCPLIDSVTSLYMRLWIDGGSDAASS